MSATVDYLERQNAALLELIEKKDEYINRLQEETAQKTQTIYTVRAEQQTLSNSIKEYVLEALRESDISSEVAEALANLCDFELTKTITITSTVEFEVEIEVPFDMEADDIIASMDYSVDTFDYSIDDFSVNVQQVDWTDNIS